MRFEDFGLNIAKARLAKDISAYELSLRIGKDASYINKVENGKVNVSLKTMIELAETLEVDIKSFFNKN